MFFPGEQRNLSVNAEFLCQFLRAISPRKELKKLDQKFNQVRKEYMNQTVDLFELGIPTFWVNIGFIQVYSKLIGVVQEMS